jgi:hypothetical protein
MQGEIRHKLLLHAISLIWAKECFWCHLHHTAADVNTLTS